MADGSAEIVRSGRHVDGVLLQRLERNDVQAPLVGRCQHHVRGRASWWARSQLAAVTHQRSPGPVRGTDIAASG